MPAGYLATVVASSRHHRHPIHPIHHHEPEHRPLAPAGVTAVPRPVAVVAWAPNGAPVYHPDNYVPPSTLPPPKEKVFCGC